MLYKPYTIEEVKKSAEQKLFTVISTFAGGGGSSTPNVLETFELYPKMKFVKYGNWDNILNNYENVRLA